MHLEIPNLNTNPVNALRRAGYTFQHHHGDEMSFVRSFSASGYPRFHIYAKTVGTTLEISIHLDMKKETYGEDTRHHGEYSNEGALKQEVERLKMILE